MTSHTLKPCLPSLEVAPCLMCSKSALLCEYYLTWGLLWLHYDYPNIICRLHRWQTRSCSSSPSSRHGCRNLFHLISLHESTLVCWSRNHRPYLTLACVRAPWISSFLNVGSKWYGFRQPCRSIRRSPDGQVRAPWREPAFPGTVAAICYNLFNLKHSLVSLKFVNFDVR